MRKALIFLLAAVVVVAVWYTRESPQAEVSRAIGQPLASAPVAADATAAAAMNLTEPTNPAATANAAPSRANDPAQRRPDAPPPAQPEQRKQRKQRKQPDWAPDSDDALDRAWKRKHGFPRDPTLAEYRNLGIEGMRRLAANGDLAAKGALGAALMGSAATREQGLQALTEAAADGSIFALHELAGQLGPTMPGGSIEMSYAYLQVAAALGDVGAVPFLVQTTGRMSPEQLASGQFRFVQLMTQLGELSMSRRGFVPPPDLRPLPPGKR